MIKGKYKLILPENLVGEMTMHEVLFQPDEDDDIGMLIMIHDTSTAQPLITVRVYLLVREYDEFNVHSELEAFGFSTHEDAIAFADRMPSMSVFELLMIMNGHPDRAFEGKSYLQ